MFLLFTSKVTQNGQCWYIILSQKSKAKRSEKQTSMKKAKNDLKTYKIELPWGHKLGAP